MPDTTDRKFRIGNSAGHCLKPADITVARHVSCRGVDGFFVTRKWLANRAAYNYDPSMGWAMEQWFEWPNGSPFREEPTDAE